MLTQTPFAVARSIRTVSRIFLCLLGFAVSIAQPAARAGTATYSYSGVPLNQFVGTSCPPVCNLRGSFTLAQSLPPNLVQDVGGAGAFTPLSFSFTDGVTTFTQLNTTLSGFAVHTDGNGNIVQWGIFMAGPGGGAGLFLFYGGPGSAAQQGVNLNSYQAYFFSNTSAGGTWSVGPFAYIGNAPPACCTLTVLDTSTNLVVTTIPVPGFGYPFGISPDQTHIYLAAGNVVDVIDVATNSVVATISGVGPLANAAAIAPNGLFGYTGNCTADFSAGSVSVFSTATNTVVATVPLSFCAGGVNVTPDGAFVYTSGNGSTVAVINTSTNMVESTFLVPVPPGAGINGIPNGNTGPVITANGTLGYVAQFVESATPGTVTVISIPTNQTVTTIPVGTLPEDIVFTPDGAYAYVSNVFSNNVSVIETATNQVIATVPVGNQPNAISITPDGAYAYVANQADSTLSVIKTSTNSVVATIPMTSPFGMLIPSATPTSQSITQPLSPTAPNTFNFGPHNLTVQYPPGTNFSGVNMTVKAAQTTQTGFKRRVAGTQFANATCIVYDGEGGNCEDYQVSCTDTGGNAIICPSEPAPSIVVKTSYDTAQTITNPGFLTAPIGTNEWRNIFTAFFLQRLDPTTKGRTTGFSEFFAVDLGAGNAQGAGTLQFLPPLGKASKFSFGETIPVKFKLTSIAHLGVSVTDAIAGITVTMVRDLAGNPTSKIVLERPSAFVYQGGMYKYNVSTVGFAPGVYILTVYGDAFVAQQVQVTIAAPNGL